MPHPSAVTVVDGTADFSGGIDSIKVSTVQGPMVPNGLGRNQLAWLNNATVRDGGILQRTGWQYKATIRDGNHLYQGKFLYDPPTADPYFIYSISGHIYRLDPDNPDSLVDLSAQFNLFNPPLEPHAYFVQAEEFLVIQAGDGSTLPLFWDGTTLRRSLGLNVIGVQALYTVTLRNDSAPVGVLMQLTGTGTHQGLPLPFSFTTPALTANVVVALLSPSNVAINDVINLGSPSNPYNFTVMAFTNVDAVVPELPAATAMDYYMGRIWYAQGRLYTAGDIVYGPNGTRATDFRDSVLKVTENPLAIAGDGFHVPTEDGNIRAIFHTANLNTQLGQGPLYIATRKAIYRIIVPTSRTDWIAANSNNQPQIDVVQLGNGPVNDRSVVHVNGDVFFQTLEPSIRSFFVSVRNFGQWGNVSLAANEQRILQFNDRSLLSEASGMLFDNRLWQTALPIQKPQGVVHQAIIPLDFVPISSFGSQRPPNWEGMYEGLDFLQLAAGDFGGRERAFGTVVSRTDSSIQLYEFTIAERTDINPKDDLRVTWIIEFPAFTWGDPFRIKKLMSAELGIDKLMGTVEFTMEFRPDFDPCWHPWHSWKECNAKNTCENVFNPVCYPAEPQRESFRNTITLPEPKPDCQYVTARPITEAYQFQCKLTIKGWCRIRGLMLHAELRERKLYEALRC